MADTSIDSKNGPSRHIPPELITQITHRVINQLQTGGFDEEVPPRPSQISVLPPPRPTPQPIPQSPADAPGMPPTRPYGVYASPSPHHPDVYPTRISPQLTSEEEQKATHFTKRRSSPPSNQSSETSGRSSTRPKGPSRLSTDTEITTLERIWGSLFDEEGRPTLRLGQLLRGLAVHIIEEHEPRHSIVITPAKMAYYYENMKVSKEVYSWSDIFGGRHSSLSQMYRDLECPHHLAQKKYDRIPDIPSLTPVGFERWVTLLLRAHPHEEFERFQEAVLKMPISNPDDSKERFPKEISRRLFPDHEDRQIRRRIQGSMVERGLGGVLRYPSQKENRPHPERPPFRNQAMEDLRVPQSPRGSVRFVDSPPLSMSSSIYPRSSLERERKLHTPSASESAIDDTPSPSPSPPSHSVAPERKRHTAIRGHTKRFQDGFGHIKPRSESFADPALRVGLTYSTSATHPERLNTNTGRRAEGPQPESPRDCGSASGGSRRYGGPPSSRPSTGLFRRSDRDAHGCEPTL